MDKQTKRLNPQIYFKSAKWCTDVYFYVAHVRGSMKNYAGKISQDKYLNQTRLCPQGKIA